MSAASILSASGFTHVSVLAAGPEDWVKAHDQALEAGA
jgi:hypothetical protein